ncbi:unnamed protein product [Spirodela intermedia]|uniref:Thioredoxin domain-containing protein n=1 Tax=Spirodela intermedia TaxID=51605 RepID=A0A7I8L2B1_SPIIN|nr:unnamed protein product [Spirodela intermedia]
MKDTGVCFLAAILAAFVLFCTVAAVEDLPDAEPRDGGEGGIDAGSPVWQVLSKKNFSSQIRFHPHALVMVTVPWSGESRFLMKEIAHVVKADQQLSGHLKLMVVYKNVEKMLADALDAKEGITLLYYHLGKSFSYQGRPRAQNILSSVSRAMSLQHVEIPFEFLSTAEELGNFFQSTDKAVLLLEFCGWSGRLWQAMYNGSSENLLSEKSVWNSVWREGKPEEINGIIKFDYKFLLAQTQGLENEKLTCRVETKRSGFPWFGEFSPANDITYLGIKARTSNTGTACTSDKFQQFESFFSELNRVVREFFLSPERQRFGVVSERSLLKFLSLEDPQGWPLLIHFSGFPSSSVILENVDALRVSLQMRHSPIDEVDGDQRNQEGVFPVDRPSLVLFIDRSSASPSIREDSKSALEVYRQLAHYYQIFNSDLSAWETFQESQNRGISGFNGRAKIKGSLSLKTTKDDDKVSSVIANEGERVSLGKVPDGSLENTAYAVLRQWLQRQNSAVQKKEIKISVLAKDIGFQLLSDDFDVEVIDSPPVNGENDQSKSPSDSLIMKSETKVLERPVESNVNVHDDNSVGATCVAAVKDGHKSELLTIRSVIPIQELSQCRIEKRLALEKSSQESSKDDFQNRGSNPKISGFSAQSPPNAPSAGSDTAKGKDTTGTDDLNHRQSNRRAFTGSFFFSDGGYRLLKSLTGGSKIPSFVILDPVSQKHYVLPKGTECAFDSYVNFVDKFLNGSLFPHQRSERFSQSPREYPSPPFVNLDFHEVDGVPWVAANAFEDLFLGSAQCDDRGFACTPKGDKLVLFCNPWCGFCQRMELVVREVYRAFKGLEHWLRGDPAVKAADVPVNGFPSIYRMDCTLNDCSSILSKFGKGEDYPTLLLFPGKDRDAITYQGPASVLDIFEFLAEHGTSSHVVNEYRGILWSRSTRRDGDGEPPDDGAFSGNARRRPEGSPISEPVIPAADQESGGDAATVEVGSVLTATEKLVGAYPFENASVLIVRADQDSGFQGLILNRRLSWEVFEGLDLDVEALRAATLCHGGPVSLRNFPLLSLARKPLQGYTQVAEGALFFGDPFATGAAVGQIRSRSPASAAAGDLWFFFGYSRWGWTQLADELADGVWQVGHLAAGGLEWPDDGGDDYSAAAQSSSPGTSSSSTSSS